MTNMPTGAALWTVQAEFTSREDAVAFMDLARELGYLSHLSARSINKPNNSPTRETRLGRLLLRATQPGRSHDLDYYRALCEANDYEPLSAAPALSKLVQEGDLRRAARGTYELPPQPGGLTELCSDCETIATCGAGKTCFRSGLPLR